MSKIKNFVGMFVGMDEDKTPTPSGLAGTPSPTDKLMTPEEIEAQWANFQKTGKMSTPGLTSVSDVVKAMPGPNLNEIQVPAPGLTPAGQIEPAAVPIRNPDGTMDFSGIYRQAGLVSPAFTADNALELISQMPGELSIESKRTMMKPMLAALGKTTGATPQTIAGDAASKITALESYRDGIQKQVGEFLTISETEIAKLEQKIAERKAGIVTATKKREETDALIATEIDRIDDVLEFFTLDVGASKLATAPTAVA